MLKLLVRLIMVGFIVFILFIALGAGLLAKAGNALIDAINGSVVHGIAQINPGNSGNTSQLQVNLQGLGPDSRYDITLDQDMCSGPVAQDIGLVTTDANGNVTSTFTVPDISKLSQHSLWVDVHQGPDKSYQSTACGQVELNGNALSQVNLSGSTDSSGSKTSPSGVNNTGNPQSTGNTPPGVTNFPTTGVAPGGSNSYDNYTYPRKY